MSQSRPCIFLLCLHRQLLLYRNANRSAQGRCMSAFSSRSDAEQLGSQGEVQTHFCSQHQQWFQSSRHQRRVARLLSHRGIHHTQHLCLLARMHRFIYMCQPCSISIATRPSTRGVHSFHWQVNVDSLARDSLRDFTNAAVSFLSRDLLPSVNHALSSLVLESAGWLSCDSVFGELMCDLRCIAGPQVRTGFDVALWNAFEIYRHPRTVCSSLQVRASSVWWPVGDQ
jgi:hypothetical protein